MDTFLFRPVRIQKLELAHFNDVSSYDFYKCSWCQLSVQVLRKPGLSSDLLLQPYHSGVGNCVDWLRH